MIKKEITYDKKLLTEWREKSLRERWWEKHRNVFDCEDLRIAITQAERAYHFGEWLVAMSFAERGYKVLVEKYRSRITHKRKYEELFRYFSPAEIDFLTKSEHQPPDLFVYKGKEHFFVEVKRDRDKLGGSQRNFFEKIERKLRCPVHIVYLRGE